MDAYGDRNGMEGISEALATITELMIGMLIALGLMGELCSSTRDT